MSLKEYLQEKKILAAEQLKAKQNYKELKKISYENEARSKKNEQDIEEIKEENKWLRRAIIGEGIGLLFAIITILIKRGMGVN